MLLNNLQDYWWLLISVLGAVLVFLLFVQGGQTMLMRGGARSLPVEMMVSSLGHKWELTFTTLVVFGGAFFASFPLFYSTSFGGAYWLWMLILLSFVLQAVSYEFRLKPGNLFGARGYDIFLFINGSVGCVLLGVAVGSFFGANPFVISFGNVISTDGSQVISQWANSHGWETIFNRFNLLLGFTVLFLARTQAALYFMNNIDRDPQLFRWLKRSVLINGIITAVLLVAWLAWLFMREGYTTVGLREFVIEPYKYFNNLVDMWWTIPMVLIGVVMFLWAVFASAIKPHYTKGIWFSGLGTVIIVLVLFFLAGYNNTPYYPSADMASSLTIRNSSSSLFTLKVMSWVSIIVPFVIAYIAYAWHAMDRKPITPDSASNEASTY